jgi:hypothetical protein
VASDDRFVSNLETQLEVIEPTAGLPGIPGGRGQVVLRAPMPVVAPGRYEAELRLPRTGAFLLRAIHRSRASEPGGVGPVVAESWGTLALSYPREYLALPPDLELLSRVAAVTQGARYPSAAAALVPGEEKTSYLRALWPWLCGLAIGLFLLDVLLRRVRMFGYRPLSL